MKLRQRHRHFNTVDKFDRHIALSGSDEKSYVLSYLLVILCLCAPFALLAQSDSLTINDFPDTIYSEYRYRMLEGFYDDFAAMTEPVLQEADWDTVLTSVMIKPGYRGDKIPQYSAVEDSLVIIPDYWTYQLQACEKVTVEKWLRKTPVEYIWIKNPLAAQMDCPEEFPRDSCHWIKKRIKEASFFNYQYELCNSDFSIDSTWHKGRTYQFKRYEITGYQENPRGVQTEMKSKQMVLHVFDLKQKAAVVRRKISSQIQKEELMHRYLFEEITPFNFQTDIQTDPQTDKGQAKQEK